MKKEKNHLTSESGRPIPDNQNIETAGPHGPALLQNAWLLEKLAHFNRERIPERVVHAKGSGAFGTLTITHDITAYTRASIFSAVGKKTDLFVRFSTVAGERGAADTERDVRGFAEQHPGILYQRPLKVSGLYSHAKKRPGNKLEKLYSCLGLLESVS